MPFMVVAGEAWAWVMGALLLGAVLQAVSATEARKAIEAIRSMVYSLRLKSWIRRVIASTLTPVEVTKEVSAFLHLSW
jgi:hypothetical protein